MSKPETNIRRNVVKLLGAAGLDPTSVENTAGPGTPDVEYIGGWLELKQVPEWPKRESTPLRVPKFYPEQRIWLRRRVKKGGRALLLIRVAREFFLFRGDHAADMLGGLTREGMHGMALRSWPSWTETKRELVTCLTSDD